MSRRKLYLAHFSIHGLLRSQNIELGRDADTGGQIQYVIELARELGKNEQVERVDLFTRQIFDPKVSLDYAQPIEQLNEKTYIIRLPFGPRRYLRKEKLWPYLEVCVDQALQYFRRLKRIPDVIHGHYADAGYVGSLLAHLLEVPLVFTGHSLGRVKQARLLEKGMSFEKIKEEYTMGYRIEAEERALSAASRVIASTAQEVKEQYEPYDHYEPECMRVIPPGVDMDRFYPIPHYQPSAPFYEELSRFLYRPHKPIILALSRPDERKNIPALIHAYGQSPALQTLANLVIVLGNRDNIQDLEKTPRTLFQKILLEIDHYDLYGKVAYPKHHRSEEIPEFYRWAVSTGGVFINPALTEPFGLTLIEAAATGLPIIATEDGGPKDIIRNCQNGLLIDPLNVKAIGEALLSALSDKKRWQQWSQKGILGAKRYYSWSSHVESYLTAVEPAIEEVPRTRLYHPKIPKSKPKFGTTKLPLSQRFIISDIDDTLIGDAPALQEFLAYLEGAKRNYSFGIATGRHIESALDILEQWEVPLPDVFVTSVGTEIYYGAYLMKDSGWEKHINFRWEPLKIHEVLSSCEGLELQIEENQRPFKISYLIDQQKSDRLKLSRSTIIKHLRQNHLAANVIVTQSKFVDVLPIRASKGLAVRYLSYRWGIPTKHFLVAGDSGNDEEMLKGEMLGVVVGNYSQELEKLKDRPRIYFAKNSYAKGILEGLQYFTFLDDNITVVEEESHET